ncbi:probable membrane-associated kinase regulator 2 [Lolium perenne]|uniref:probable membrane-associated kinase regulator 2 n=1 Tax=Lolium perenne TaxID=4522 RepID=UPI0021EADBEB|nr:probable membrane-associated kinase regulator 2 [Lolium perenne]
MESFSFLKYLRGGAVAGYQRAPVPATTIAASPCEDGGGGGGDVVDDDAAFFDLEFAVPAGDEGAASDEAEEERVEFNFSVAGDVASGGAEVVAVEPVGDDGAVAKEAAATAEAEPPAASFLRPATKFRVLLLKLRKPKLAAAPADGNGAAAPKPTNRFLIKFRVEDAPFASLFTRDTSSRTSDAGARPALQAAQPSDAVAITAEERRFAKEVVLKYLNKIKPLYVKVSRRYGERLRFAGASEGEETDAEPEPEPSPSATPAPSTQPRAAAAAPPQPQPQPAVVVACGVRAPRAGVPAGLKQACKRLGKSRSASSAVAAAPSPSQTPPTPTGGQPQRRDDSLLQLQDGIQSAIAHCKRSFNASKGSESPLLRSMTDPAPRTGGAADAKDGGDGA